MGIILIAIIKRIRERGKKATLARIRVELLLMAHEMSKKDLHKKT